MFEIQKDKLSRILPFLSLEKLLKSRKSLVSPPPPRLGLKRLKPLKRAFKTVFCLSLLTFAYLPGYFAACTPAEKAKMVKLGMEITDIQATCNEPESKEEVETKSEVKEEKTVAPDETRKEAAIAPEETKKEQKIDSSGSSQKGGFVGLSLISERMPWKNEVKVNDRVVSETSGTDGGSGYAFQGGYNFENWRVYGLYSSSSYTNFTTSTLLVLANWIHESGFFIGGGLGTASMTWKRNDTNTTALFDISGKTASSGSAAFELGGIYQPTERLNLDFGYRSVSAKLETKLSFPGGGEVVGTGTGIVQLWLGANYLF